MRKLGASSVGQIGTLGDQEEVVVTGSAVSAVEDYQETAVTLYTDGTDIRYSTTATATGAVPSKSLKAGERLQDFVPAGGVLSFYGNGTIEIIPIT